MNNVLLIELFPYHTECLYSQLLFLKESGYRTTLVCDARVEGIVREFGMDVACVTFDFSRTYSFVKLRNFIVRNNFTTVVLNTAQGSRPLKLMLIPFPRRINFFGTIHNVDKISSSFGQTIISRKICSYYVLSAYQMHNFPTQSHLRVQYFNPSFFPDYEVPADVLSKGDDVWVVVAGGLEYKRRDYDFLINFVDKARLAGVKFILLGNATRGNGVQIVEEISRRGLDKYFVCFNSFVPNDVFHYYLKKSDYLFPLIHPGVPHANNYLKTQISGTYPLSLAYGKPMLCHAMFSNVEAFSYPSLFYNDDVSLTHILTNRETVKGGAELNFEEERKRYVSVLI